MSAEVPASLPAPSPCTPQPAGNVALCGCGAGPHPEGKDRCSAGHLWRGNATARKHGLHVSAVAEALAAERTAFVAASLADDGGEAECGVRRQALHAYRGRLHSHIGQLSDAIENHGLFDRRGRLRASWLQRLEGLVDRARGIDATLGLDRRQRRAVSVTDYVREQAARNSTEGSTS